MGLPLAEYEALRQAANKEKWIFQFGFEQRSRRRFQRAASPPTTTLSIVIHED